MLFRSTLEVQDLMALLTFLVSPFDNLRLAHALRSPLFAASDDDLVRIALAVKRMPDATWWETLSRLPENECNATLARARRLLTAWLARADTLPVHDQLDRIYFEADVLQRYHDSVPLAMRGAVAANLNAFMRRALDADAGRFLSLPRFVADLAELRNAPAVESPDEGVIGDAGDAVRIHTVHGAKGLEAPIVWLPDAAAQSANHGGYDVLLDWPADAVRPTHFSMWSRKDEQTPLQRAIADSEGDIARREHLNLLYVAMTRAKQVLIVSGVEGRGGPGQKNSWYEKIAAVAGDAGGAEMDAEKYQLKHTLTEHPPITIEADSRLEQPLPTGTRLQPTPSAGMLHGTRFHAVMEQLTQSPDRANDDALQRQLQISADELGALMRDAERMINAPEYRRYFDATRYVRAANEAPLVTERGELLRIDRLVEFDEEVCVLDYKTGSLSGVDEATLASYREQVRNYCVHIARVFSGTHAGKQISGLILFTGGGSIEIKV